jgi:hypothetical protein
MSHEKCSVCKREEFPNIGCFASGLGIPYSYTICSECAGFNANPKNDIMFAVLRRANMNLPFEILTYFEDGQYKDVDSITEEDYDEYEKEIFNLEEKIGKV